MTFEEYFAEDGLGLAQLVADGEVTATVDAVAKVEGHPPSEAIAAGLPAK